MSTLKVTNIESPSGGGVNAKLADINGGQLGNRNLVINGAMQVAQRGTTSSSTNDYCSLDRFRVDANQGAWEFSQESLSSGDPYNLGFRHFARLKNTTVTTANSRRRKFQQYIEAQNVAQSGWNYVSTTSFITVSFWVRSSVAGIYYFYLQTPNNSPDKSFTFAQTLAADTWTKVEKTISGDSSLVINNDSSTGLRISFNADHGTDFTGSVTLNQWETFNNNARTPDTTTGWSNTLNATFDVTGVQIEVGDVATAFEHRSYGDELQRCLRYYNMLADGNAKSIVSGAIYATNNFYSVFNFPVAMRAAPTLDSSSGSNYFDLLSDGVSDNFNAVLLGNTSTNAAELRAHSSEGLSGATAGHAAWMRTSNSAAHIALTAEL